MDVLFMKKGTSQQQILQKVNIDALFCLLYSVGSCLFNPHHKYNLHLTGGLIWGLPKAATTM